MNRIPSTVKTMALAVALALPAAPTLAASMSDIVTTRDDQDVQQQFGRDSVYAMQTRQPLQTESHVSSDSGIGKFFAGVGAAGSSAWHKMTSVFEPKSETSHTVVAQQPQWYGRAGGYVGTDQLALLERAGPATDVSQPVIAGEAMVITPAERDIRYPAARESQLYGRNEDRFPQTTETAPVAESQPVTSEQPVIANDVQAPAAGLQSYGREDQPYARSEDQLNESAAPGNDQAATAHEGAGEAAQSAPSPDSVTVMDEEKERLGEQAADQSSRSERSSGRL